MLIPSGVGKRKSTRVASDDDRAQRCGERHECFQRASERVPMVGPCARASSISAVSAVSADTLASMKKHSRRGFTDLGLTPNTCTWARADTHDEQRTRNGSGFRYTPDT